MKIDPRKIQLAEKDIEDWLFENPTAVHGVVKWVGRQVEVPSGRIDLLGFNEYSNFVVVEIKNSQPSPAALTQVCRYARDIELAMNEANPFRPIEPWKILICKEPIETQIIFEANALGVYLETFDVHYDLKLSDGWGFSKRYRAEIKEKIYNIANSGLLDDFAATRKEDEAQFLRNKRAAMARLSDAINRDAGTSGDD